MSLIQFLRGLLALLTIPPLTAVVCLCAMADVRWFRHSKAKAQQFPRTWGRILCRLANIRVRVEGGGAGFIQPNPTSSSAIIAAWRTSWPFPAISPTITAGLPKKSCSPSLFLVRA